MVCKMIVKFHPGKHSFRNGASNACVYTKAAVQAMPLFPQTRKITRTAAADRVIFLLVEAPAPSSGEHKCSGTQPSGLRLRDSSNCWDG